MSMVALDLAKRHLRVLHDDDDDLIRTYIDTAEDEMLQFMDRRALPLAGGAECCSETTSSEVSSDGELAPSVRGAVLLLVEAAYYSKSLSPYEHQLRRTRAEQLCMPYRCRMGV